MDQSYQFIQEIFNAQLANQYTVASKSVLERKVKLRKLKKAIEITFREEIRSALFNDYGKHPSEVDLIEIYPVISEIKLALRKLGSWAANEKVKTPLSLIGSKSYIHKEAKGVCLLISPWNFPINLTFGPLVSAIAAGNTVIIKPSEHTPNSSAIIKKIISSLFNENEIVVIEGEAEVSTKLLELPFHHIFFTGSTAVGKIVMTAAAKNLSSITLELGGKSPVIVDKSANLDVTAKRIVWGKYTNNGQVCIAPDYIFVHEDVKVAFIEKMKTTIEKFYGKNVLESIDLSKIVNQNHFDRAVKSLNNALENGAKVLIGGKNEPQSNAFEPTLLENVSYNSEMMTQEIFGPCLPIFTFSSVNAPIKYICKNGRPLALYVFAKNEKVIQKIISETRAGTTCINNSNVQFSNPNLPFGGINNSGIGKSHGKFGFDEFTNARSILKQRFSGPLEFIMPPYSGFKQKLIDLTIKWF
jgi:aldehyde dehydrogenase (NAD+)